MTRRASLPGADELFRSTTTQEPAVTQVPEPVVRPVIQAQPAPPSTPVVEEISRQSAKSTLPRHDEKITFYCTGEELTRIERARLDLRADHRIPSDRGRIVRAALAEALEDFETRGPNSALVKRLQEQRGQD